MFTLLEAISNIPNPEPPKIYVGPDPEVCVLCAGETDRLVVFRLGRMQGVLGPGRVVTFPWIDSYKRVNVGASAFRYLPYTVIRFL
jgi:hypothetical protein